LISSIGDIEPGIGLVLVSRQGDISERVEESEYGGEGIEWG
jgi:hypothetical protein